MLEKVKAKIKQWYLKEYPTDELGNELPNDLTFYDILKALNEYKDVYELMGGADDSIIRERIFAKLSELIDVDYNDIYEQWLKCCED